MKPRKFDIRNYRNEALIGELERRINGGSNILNFFPSKLSLSLKSWLMEDSGIRCSPGSERARYLRFGFSDRELSYEILKRLHRGSYDCFLRFQMMIESQNSKWNTIHIFRDELERARRKF